MNESTPKFDSTSAHPPRNHHDATQVSRVPSANPPSSTELTGLKIKLHQSLRQYPDFPSPGVLFEDILPLFQNPSIHEDLITALELHIKQHFAPSMRPDIIVGLEARGFLFGPTVALRIGAGFVPVRKPDKLPGKVEEASFQKEYGKDLFQVQRDAIKPGQQVLIVDDVIATGMNGPSWHRKMHEHRLILLLGGSAQAAGSLVKKLGGILLGYVFILELEFLKGRDKLDAPVHTLLKSQEASLEAGQS